jgi:ketosteroid isomerase-like protein
MKFPRAKAHRPPLGILSGMPVPDAIVAAMRQTNELFSNQVSINRNMDALDKVYTADARILPPGAPIIQGRQNIKEFWRQAVAAMDVKTVTLSTVDAQAAGDSVIEIGRAEITNPAGVTTVKYVVHWKQEDGLWKWQTDIWNMDQ